MRLHHLGIATEDAAGAAERLAALLDVPICHTERFDGLAICFLELPSGYLELLEPVDGGTIRRFLDRGGEGIHHVAFETDDLESTLAGATAHGIELIDESPRPGAWGHEVAFLHPSSTGGVLIEFVEP